MNENTPNNPNIGRFINPTTIKPAKQCSSYTVKCGHIQHNNNGKWWGQLNDREQRIQLNNWRASHRVGEHQRIESNLRFLLQSKNVKRRDTSNKSSPIPSSMDKPNKQHSDTNRQLSNTTVQQQRPRK